VVSEPPSHRSTRPETPLAGQGPGYHARRPPRNNGLRLPCGPAHIDGLGGHHAPSATSDVDGTSARVSGRTMGVLIHLYKRGDPGGWPVVSVATAEPLRGRVAWTLRCRLVLGTWLVRPHGLAELGAGLVAAFPVVRRTAERLARGLPA
jgi:hypothetical protein